MNLEFTYWAGTETSLATHLMAMKKADTLVQPKADMATDAQRAPRLFSKVGDVGVVTISGSLVNNASWINEFVGATGYPEIRDALMHAVNDPACKAIVLDINSGGGAVSGVSDTADLIKKIDAEVKPVHTYSDGAIASAAYWLGASARSLDIGKVTEAGSIGVLTVHKEFSQALKNEGINATVLRAGEFKALGNPYETLSDKAKAEIQGQLDQMYTMFAQHVADARGVSYAVADQKMGQGRVFMGQSAVDVGLADCVTSFDAVISKVQGAIDSQKKSPQYGANFSKGPAMKVALTEQQIAAMAEGGVAVAAIATAETDAALAAEAAAKVVADATAATAAAAEPAPAEAKPAESPELVAFLKTSLAEAQASNTNLTIELRDLKASSEKLSTTHAALRSIAVASVDRLKVALGGTAGSADALADDSLLAEHASLRAQFEGKFKAGGVAAVSTAATPDPKSDVADPVHAARIASTRLAK
jgi:signal peptide peptidase SppA